MKRAKSIALIGFSAHAVSDFVVKRAGVELTKWADLKRLSEYTARNGRIVAFHPSWALRQQERLREFDRVFVHSSLAGPEWEAYQRVSSLEEIDFEEA